MRRRRLKTIVGSHILFSFILCCSGIAITAAEEITPDRTISVVRSNPQIPEWKKIWDSARNHVKEKRLEEAAQSYADLLTIKPDVEEASWEYCKVLFRVGDFTRLAKIVAVLLEHDQYRTEYQLMAGRVALQEKSYEKAISHFGRVLEKNPTGDHSNGALEGMADSLKARGRADEAFILYEQLLNQHNIPRNTLLKVAVEAYDLGKMAKSRFIMGQILENHKIDNEVLARAIEIFDAEGFESTLEKLLKQYLRIHPGHVALRLKLVGLLDERDDYSGVLENMSYLLDSNVNAGGLFLRGAEIALTQLERPDRALIFLNRHHQLNPTEMKIGEEIKRVQRLLAEDLLAIVENDGAEMLWKDLIELAPNRLAIYKEMADFLEQKGKIEPLIKVLQIILQHSPQKDIVAYRLAQQCRDLGRYGETLRYLKTINISHRNFEYLIFRGDTERLIGLEIDSLHTLEKALQINPANSELRRRCLQLAGSLGLVDRQLALFRPWLTTFENQLTAQDAIKQIRSLGYNYLLLEAEAVAALAMEKFGADPDSIVFVTIALSKVQRRVGKKRRAAQTLRQQLNNNYLTDLIAFELAEFAIEDKNEKESAEWLEVLQKQSFSGTTFYSEETYKGRLQLLQAKYYADNGIFSDAVPLMASAREQFGGRILESAEKELLGRIEKEYISLQLLNGNSKEALEHTISLPATEIFDPELFVLNRIATENTNFVQKEKAAKDELYYEGNPILSRFLAVAEQELIRERYREAENYLKIISEYAENSVLGDVLLSQLLLQKGEITAGSQMLRHLFERYVNEPYYCEKNNYIKTIQGQYDDAIEQLSSCYGTSADVEILAKHLVRHNDDGGLRLARLLWAQKRHKQSLRLYENLLSPSITAILTQQFSEKKINYFNLTQQESFWTSMMNLLQSKPEIVDEIMKPSFLMNNLGSNSGTIVAQNYEKYSWQKLINSEYQAREAVYKRNYSFAEQRYRTLLETEKTTESMADLASIYGRIGEYRKEAQVYKDLKKSGATSPELNNSIEQSSIRLKPQNIIDGVFRKKEGRRGYIDLEHVQIGTAFWFIHDLNKDFRFSYENNNYKSVDGAEKIGSNTIFMKTDWELTPNYELTAGVGVEKLNSESTTNLLYQVRLDGQLEEGVTGFIELHEELVDDTVASIKEHISARSFSTGLGFDTTFGLAFGGDLRYRSYSDNNSQNYFHGYSAYTIFGELVRLDFRYDFHYTNNDQFNPSVNRTEVIGGEEEILSYWSPDTFTEHELGVHFQHDFLGYEDGENRKMSYYALDASIGLEENETLVYSTMFDIFLEMSPHFLLKGNFSFSTSDDYEETGMSASLHYRW